MNMKSICLIFL